MKMHPSSEVKIAMPIIVNLDVMLARRKMRSKELAERIGITEQNVSLLKSGKVKGVRFDTLDADLRSAGLPARRHPGISRRCRQYRARPSRTRLMTSTKR